MSKQICHACEPGYHEPVAATPWDDLAECSPSTTAAVMGAPIVSPPLECEFCGRDHLAAMCGNK